MPCTDIGAVSDNNKALSGSSMIYRKSKTNNHTKQLEQFEMRAKMIYLLKIKKTVTHVDHNQLDDSL